MLISPNLVTFELGPKETRILDGQALFSRVHRVRAFSALGTGFTGQIEYRDAFGDLHAKEVCHDFLALATSASGGACGTVMQRLRIQ
jgi:hypothetical protein